MATEKPGATTEKKKMEEEEEADIKYRGWKAMPYVIGNETFEKLGSMGTSSNLLVYLTTIFHLQSVTAATTLNIFNGTTNLATVLGAFVSDTYLGRYWTLGFASIFSLTGMLMLTLTAAITALHPPQCKSTASQQCSGPSPAQLAVLFLSFFFLIIGAGGIRPCNLAFGADQFNPHTDSGRRGINSFFNWYYFTNTFSMMLSSTVVIYVQTEVSWALGLAIPTAFMLFSCLFFFVGTPIYVRVKPEGSPFTTFTQVLVAAYKKRHLQPPADHESAPRLLFNPPLKTSSLNAKLPHTNQFLFLDKAAIVTSTDDGSSPPGWRLTSLQQVEEVKCLLRIIPVWSTGIMLFGAVIQNSIYVVFQALQSKRSLGHTSFEIPPASFSVFAMLALTVWIPIYDRLIVPRLRRITGHEGGITLLQRMGVGLVIANAAMVVAAIIEKRRRSLADSSIAGAVSSMSSLWLIPQLTLLGLAEAFNSIGQLEFYYKQFPENMRSVAGCLVFLSISAASYLSGFMITMVHRTTDWLDNDLNKGKLDYFYFLLAFIGALNICVFVVCAKWYRYKGTESQPEISLEEGKTNASLI